METEKNAPLSDKLQEMLEESAESRRLKFLFRLRIAGFSFLALAFITMFLWRKGYLAPPVFQKVGVGLGVAGVLLYFGARALEITRTLRNRRKK